jgi:hypothetical protein
MLHHSSAPPSLQSGDSIYTYEMDLIPTPFPSPSPIRAINPNCTLPASPGTQAFRHAESTYKRAESPTPYQTVAPKLTRFNSALAPCTLANLLFNPNISLLCGAGSTLFFPSLTSCAFLSLISSDVFGPTNTRLRKPHTKAVVRGYSTLHWFVEARAPW